MACNRKRCATKILAWCWEYDKHRQRGPWRFAPEFARTKAKLQRLKNRGVNDIFMACVDELEGFPETIEAIYLHTEVQLCIVHLVRASLNDVPWKHRKLVAADLRRDLSCGHGGGSQASTIWRR